MNLADPNADHNPNCEQASRLPTSEQTTIQKRVYVGIWINRALLDCLRFEKVSLVHAASLAMHIYRAEGFCRRAGMDPLLRASKHPMARLIRQRLGIAEGNAILPPLRFSFAEPHPLIRQWAHTLDFDQLIANGTISDPAVCSGLRAVARASTRHRFAATRAALRE